MKARNGLRCAASLFMCDKRNCPFIPPPPSISAVSEDKAYAITSEELGLDTMALRIASEGIELLLPSGIRLSRWSMTSSG